MRHNHKKAHAPMGRGALGDRSRQANLSTCYYSQSGPLCQDRAAPPPHIKRVTDIPPLARRRARRCAAAGDLYLTARHWSLARSLSRWLRQREVA